MIDSSAQPLVSVIVIFLDAAKFIEEAIGSVLTQTYDRWELLLVDDGSTDASTQIARSFVDRFPEKVRYLEHEGHINRGMSATRNLGLRHARGEFVAYLDSDDVWLPHKLERQVAIMQSHPEAAMVYGATQYWHGWTGASEDQSRDHVPRLGIEANVLYRPPELTVLLYPLGTGTAPCPCDLLVRRAAAEEVGGFEEDFRGKFQLYEDQAFLAKVYIRHPVFVSDENWARYRIHNESCVATVTRAGDYRSVRRRFLNWLEQYLADQNIVDARVAQALQSAIAQLDETEKAGEQPSCTSTSNDPAVRQECTIQALAEPVPAVNEVEMGSLRRVTPVSRNWGFDRGRPIDRYYIEGFLAAQADAIRGRVLEIGDNSYTRRFGGERVTASDVLHVQAGQPQATIIADLTSADHIPSNVFDCIILTQTLQFIYDVRAAIRTLYRILKPGGVVLATFSGISHTNDLEWGGSWYWNFTTLSAQRLFEEAFLPAGIRIQAYGNVLTAISFLHGMAVEELQPQELDFSAPGYDVTIAVRASKTGRSS